MLQNLFWHFTVRINCSSYLKSSSLTFSLEFEKVYLITRTISSHSMSQNFLKQSTIFVSLGRVLELEKISLFVSKEMWGQLHVPFRRPCYSCKNRPEFKFPAKILMSFSQIELMINKIHGLSPSGGLVSPSGGFASLFFSVFSKSSSFYYFL